MFKNGCALAKVHSVLYALLMILVVGNLSEGTNHEKEIRKIETGIDQLIYRIIKLENGIDAIRAPDKVRRYKSLGYRVLALEGTGCRDDFFQCGGNDPQCVNNLLVCDGLRDCRNGADEEDCGLPFHVGDKFDVMPLSYDCTLDTDPLINPYFIIDKVEIIECFKAIAKVHVGASFDDVTTTRLMRTSGVYNMATGILEVVWPRNGGTIGWFVDFKHHITTFTLEQSNAICGKATFSLNRES